MTENSDTYKYMVRIYYDNIIFSLQQVGGISVYWYELIRRVSTKIEVKFINHQQAQENLFFKLLHPALPPKTEFAIPLFIKRFLPYLGYLPPKSVFHSSYQRVSLQKNVVNITTIHDCGYELGHMRQSWRRSIHVYFKRLAIRRSDGIIAISQNTKKDLLQLYPFLNPNHIKVVYNGISEEYYQLDPNLKPDYLPQKYILFIGMRDSYKNFILSVKAVSALKDFQMVIVGGRSLSSTELDLLKRELPGRYIFIQSASNEDLCRIYNYAHCLLYPSIYEGFGIPIAEAMRCGCPVIALNSSSIPEVAGDAAILLEKYDLHKIPEAITLLDNIEFRMNLISKGKLQSVKFSWDNCAQETLEFYAEVYCRKFGKCL